MSPKKKKSWATETQPLVHHIRFSWHHWENTKSKSKQRLCFGTWKKKKKGRTLHIWSKSSVWQLKKTTLEMKWHDARTHGNHKQKSWHRLTPKDVDTIVWNKILPILTQEAYFSWLCNWALVPDRSHVHTVETPNGVLFGSLCFAVFFVRFYCCCCCCCCSGVFL